VILLKVVMQPAWPNGYGVGLLNRRLGVRVPPWVNILNVLTGYSQSQLEIPLMSAGFRYYTWPAHLERFSKINHSMSYLRPG
jgi:hypothetical protein